MPRRHTITKALTLAMAGAVLLSACGSSGESRTRNAAIETVGDCYSSQGLKDIDLARIERVRVSARTAVDTLEALREEYDAAANQYAGALNELTNDPNSGITESEVETLREQADRARVAFENASNLADRIGDLDVEYEEASSKPICIGVSEQTSDDSGNTIEDNGQSEEPTTTTTSADEASVESETPEDNEASGEVSSAEAECAAVPKGGTEYVINVGETATIDFELCDGANGLRVKWPVGSAKKLKFKKNNPSSFSFTAKIAGRTRVGFTQVNRTTKPVTVLSKATRVWITAVDPSSSDDCSGKAPTGTWDGENDILQVSATCEPVDFIQTSIVWRAVDGERRVLFEGQRDSGSTLIGLLVGYGPGEFTATLVHGRNSDEGPTYVGETGTVSVTVTEAESEKDGTVTNGALPPSDPESRSAIQELPVFSLAADDSTSGGESGGAGETLPTVALPAETTAMTCAANCLDEIVKAAGFDAGTVEVTFDGETWSEVKSSSAVVVPAGTSTLRVRVTPESGDAVILSTSVVRDSISESDAEPNETEDLDIASVGNLVDDVETSGSAFPWWLVVLIALLVVAGGMFARRRLQARTAGD